ncbi:hypothetical protein [Belnapia rosea]|uniref:Apea-like HEPN domain-containing protein n=1 Tax=Belnapia rosea TaxID=938405 RepID=A0A1G7BW11_9PROT|nr:hypothetical protein [Belnapia rosea]SDE30750.1 hypothetical protein SAMN04487779_102731 [Belnapia rosea]
MTAYTLRVSIKVQGEKPIAGLESSPTIEVNRIVVTIKQNWPQLILSAHGFQSEIDAEDFLEKVKLALFNLAVKFNIAYRHNFPRNPINYFDGPIALSAHLANILGARSASIDGVAEAEGYSIYESEKKISFIDFQPGNLTTSIGWISAQASLLEGLQATPRLIDPKTAIARDLYLASYYETSQRARFLTLIMCLEVMAPRPKRHQKLIDALRCFRSGLNKLRVNSSKEEEREIEGVLSQIGFSEEQSIKLRIQSLVRSEVPLDISGKEALAERMNTAYKVRSNISHNGDDPNLPNVFDDVLQAVKLVLTTRLGLPLD